MNIQIKKSTAISLLTAFVAALSLLAIFVFIYQSEKKRLIEEEHAEVFTRASVLRARLETAIYSRLFLTRSLAAFVSTYPEVSEKEFNRLAKELVGNDPVISSISLAKDSVINYIYPYKGHESAIGLNLLAHPERQELVRKVIETRKAYVQGPTALVEGGIAFISYTPIYVASPGGKDDYWGLADIVIYKDSLLQEAGFTRGLPGLEVALRGKDGAGAAGEPFFGSEKLFDMDPVLLDIFLPVGHWQMAATPKGGWSSAFKYLQLHMVAGFFMPLFGGLFVFALLHEAFRLRDEVKVRNKVEMSLLESDKELRKYRNHLETLVYERTAELEKANRDLMCEIEERMTVQKELHRMSGMVLTAQEEERKRLSRELHDGLGQSLLAIKLKLQMSGGNDKDSVLLDMSNLMEELRGITAALRPPILEGALINEVILWYSKKFQDCSGIHLDVNADEEINASPLVIDNIYRILQEALGNISRYSGASRVEIALKEKNELLCLTIKDDGVGFEPSELPSIPDGIGLMTMKERAELLGGSLMLETSKGAGVLIKVEVPIL